ncbi:MAG: hypothetical protein COV29_03345 [Candidatus Yanofskybacteria bacterium CG10_big_fil_rev_8_21_14_0_10_36_16]|uniref:Uncharacterized protein n=1 Tax=Candidatus Yanofskybacteria bacterium CG10_big_fil_rev_8_21_14_0_10_36_16 TaxID=1975096 RepID=A0A2J0Q7B6_9BACT|nr:MAG: hypothetical protein COV29_03345 [Candidatus Yanofskybacteria bacterium CG10_big_fil_rev_8_21_14_0_10_36_16]
MKNKIVKTALINTLLTAGYVILVASFMFYAPRILNFDKGPDTVFAPILMLLLFVLSAAITGWLVFGKSVMWYLDGFKKEALSLLSHTLGLLFALIAVALLLLLSF